MIEQDLDTLITFGTELGASQLHLSVGSSLGYRIAENLRQFHTLNLSNADFFRIIRVPYVPEREWQKLLSIGSLSLLIRTVQGRICRAHLYVHRHGFGAVLSLLNTPARTLEQLRLGALQEPLSHLSGLVLLAGTDRAILSELRASILQFLNAHIPRHVIAIESIVEYPQTSQTALIQQRSFGTEADDAFELIEAAIQERPEVLILGDIPPTDASHRIWAELLSRASADTLVIGTLLSAHEHSGLGQVLETFLPEGRTWATRQMEACLRVLVQVGAHASPSRDELPIARLTLQGEAMARLLQTVKV